MRLLYCHDNIYQKGEDGLVYSPGQFPYAYWETFTNIAEDLVIIGREKPIQDDRSKLNLSSGPKVSFAMFPNINTVWGRLTYGHMVNKRLKQLVSVSDAVVIRAVSDLGWLTFKHARRMKKPIAMEMAACAWDSTWNHGHPLGKIYAFIRWWRDRTITKKADYVMYVSEHFLQERYPTSGMTAHASNVRVDAPHELVIEDRLKKISSRDKEAPQVIGLIGNLDNKIKGVSDVLYALHTVQTQKPGSFIFRHLGPGDQSHYIAQAEALHLSDVVRFDGMMQSGGAVLEWLSGIDLYLQPSYQEGVPRATIEAMSMGCPAIGSTAGGIPELINNQWLIKPGDEVALANLIMKMLENPFLQTEAACENYLKSQNYTSDKLVPRRRAFWAAFAEFAQSKGGQFSQRPRKPGKAA